MMTAPTQAQIEAAARAMFELEYKLMGSDWVIPKWDESYRSYWGPLASAALTVAAEVGEQTHQQRIKNEVALVERAIAHTIERCAQVADEMQLDIRHGNIAAAIRALKDQP